MANIIPKLNLNKTPNLVENNSLVFAKNIRLDVDGTIHRDYGILPLTLTEDKTEKCDLIDYKNLIYRIKKDINVTNDTPDWLKSIDEKLDYISNKKQHKGVYKIVGIVPDSNDFYLFIYGTYVEKLELDENQHSIPVSLIVKYSEKEDKFSICNCAWHWNGGTINGVVIKNLVGDTILNIGETDIVETVLFKSINLTYSSINDDESIYTQTPKIPITNLTYAGDFAYTIPNGVYQFFVRYEIRKDFYTDWFPASTELFVGNKNSIITSFGTLTYTNTHRDSDNSFILNVEHLIKDNKKNYKRFQIGFLLSHDEAVYARAWKHFSLNDNISINFDYKSEDAIEIEVNDLLKFTYGLYNVGNITSFKNKLYISNYTETDFNDKSLQESADKIDIELVTQSGENSYDDKKIIDATVGGENVISGLTIGNTEVNFYGENGIFEKICTTEVGSGDKDTIIEAIDKILKHEDTEPFADDFYGIRIVPIFDKLSKIQQSFKDNYVNTDNGNIKVEYEVTFPNNNITSWTVNDKTGTNIKTTILNELYKTRYLTHNANWVNINGNADDTITVKLKRKATIKTTTTYREGGITPTPGKDSIYDDLIESDDKLNSLASNKTVTKTTIVDYVQFLTFKYVAWADKLQYDNSKFLTKYTTLLPYQKYKFYVHYVKDTGEISNGFECSKIGEIEIPYSSNCTIIYPKFINIEIPEGYAACFLSICHTKTNTATLFNISEIKNNNDKVIDATKLEASCIDINMMLIPGYKKLHIRQGTKEVEIPSTEIGQLPTKEIVDIETHSGTYYYSNDASSSRYFGADGVITLDASNDINKDNLAYIVNDYAISDSDNIELIKCTPYLCENNLTTEAIVNGNYNSKVYKNYANMNLLGYICGITPLLRDICIRYYSDGASVYYKDSNNSIDGDLQLTELSKYSNADDGKKIKDFKLKPSDVKYIYSNYNLNFVSLSEEPKMNIKSYYETSSDDTSSSTDSKSMILRLIPSQLMSDIYILSSMYKNYTRKTFSTYTENEITRFNNTVRSSILYGDENKINILAFDAEDYYNIPTNRGIITNLIAVGDSILVHTKDSMFKFTGSNNLQSSNGEIQPTETQPFNTGVSEVFGSDFGFAGLQHKTDSIVTEQGYIFFDRDSRIIYMYSGQGQIVKLNESIEKLFRYKNISNVYFANDYYNNRFFISVLFYDKYYESDNIKYKYYPITLSFNIHQNIKSFVSLHDFYYDKAFNTKTNCYFLTNDKTNICTINKKHKGCYTLLEIPENNTEIYNNLYPYKKEIKTLNIKNESTSDIIEENINSYDSIIDIIDNTNFETVKTLNAVNWCSNIIKSEYENINESDVATLRMAEDINAEYPCKSFRVYTDTCMTDLLYFKNISNNHNLMSADSYKAPRYNQGFWTTNYFRNILNDNNTNNKIQNYISDENSLIEGKYFVIRFVFDDEFKLETISLNYNTKL